MALSHSPQIVTNGLVFALDAANPKNYDLTSVEYLIVAGGGSGGSYVGGGGGGGGVLQGSVAIGQQSYTIVVGDGGASVGSISVAQNIQGNNGGNSSAFGFTALGGGGGGRYAHIAGSSGGSGGGSGGFQGSSSSGGAGTSGQGNAGGGSIGPRPRGFTGGGGGGGAGTAGQTSTDSLNTGGNGGDGIISSILGVPYYFGGGGGGGNYADGSRPGNGGLGGGGGGSSNTANVSGVGGGSAINNTSGGNGSATGDPNNLGGNGAANSGGGGGGNGHYGLSGAGGSGIVIVRYPGPQRAIGGTVTSAAGYTVHTFTTVGNATFTPLVGTNSSTIIGLSDFSGNNKFSTTQNSPIFSGGYGGSIVFDGINEYSTFTIPNPTTQITVESWIYPRKAPSTGTVRGSALSGDPDHYLGIIDSIDGGVTHSLHWALRTSSTRQGSVVGNIPRYSWSHIVGTYDGSRQKAYINGSLVYDVALTGTISGNGSWVLGTYYGALTDGVHNFDGFIGPSRIYDRALTSAEIQKNYNASKGRYEKGGINNPLSSPTEARILGYSSGDYYFKSGSMSSAQLLEFQRDYYENRGWVCVFRSPYRSTATTNKIDLSIPMGGLLVQRDTLDLRGAVYWSTPITYNTVGGGGNNTADSGTGYAGSNARRVILGGSGGHGLYNTGQSQCNWGSSAGAIGAGWDGSTCGTFPNDLIWGTGNASTATYDNRSGTWSHWITW